MTSDFLRLLSKQPPRRKERWKHCVFFLQTCCDRGHLSSLLRYKVHRSVVQTNVFFQAKHVGNATADATVTALGEPRTQSPLPATRARRMRGPPRGPVRTREPPQNQFRLHTTGPSACSRTPGSEDADLGESDSGRRPGPGLPSLSSFGDS